MTKHTVASVATEIFDRVPGYERTVVTCVVGRPDAVRMAGAVAMATPWATQAVARTAEVDDVLAVPSIASWRRAFRAVGINPAKYRPAVEALLRRARGGSLPFLGRPLIDIGTAVSLATLSPVGVHTYDDLDGPVRLDIAKGTERFASLSGERAVAEPGEVVFRCGGTVLTRRWAWRQGAVGSVREDSRLLAVNVDSLDGSERERATELLVRALTALGATGLATHRLTPEAPEATLEW